MNQEHVLQTLGKQWLELGAEATKAWNNKRPDIYNVMRVRQYQTATAYAKTAGLPNTDTAVADIRRKYTH